MSLILMYCDWVISNKLGLLVVHILEQTGIKRSLYCPS